jgi:two-component system chemotaxis response regulator CheY
MAKKILVVDDSEIVRNLHSFIFKSMGYEVVDATNGYEALEKLYQDEFDLIATDVNMPKMDGIMLVKEIRKEEKYKDIPIIIISTESEANDKQIGFNAGANVYIVKPVKEEALILNTKMLLHDE